VELKKLTEQFSDILVEARGRGLLIGLEIDLSKDKRACKIFATRCAEKGVYFGYYGAKQHVLRIAPPLTIDEQDAEIIVNTIRETANEMKSGYIPQTTVEKADKFAIGLVIMSSY